MKIQHFMALVVLSLATVPGARAAVRWFKARTLGLFALACLLVAAPAAAQVNYAVSGGTAYVTYSFSASGNIVIAPTFNGYPVTSILGRAFEGASGLTSVTIPSSVTNMGSFAFRECSSLTNISVDAANPAYSSLNRVLFDKAQTTLITFPIGRSGSYVIPNTVTSIVTEAFYRCFGLTSVTIPNSVTSIGSYVFYQCNGLTSVTIPDSVTSIQFRSFELCTGLTNVIFGNSVTNIADYLFWGCSSLANVTMGNSVASIGVAAFQLCPSLTSVTIPNSVTHIWDIAFFGTSLTSVTVPNSVTTIRDNAFSGCPSLTNFSVAAANPAYSSLDGVLFDKAQTTLISFPLGRGGSYSYVIPNSVTRIVAGVFYNCTSLTNVTMGNSVASIGAAAFYFCTSLTSVTIPNSVIDIGDSAFAGCGNLTGMTIPNNVTNIGTDAFSGCTNLTSLTIGNSVTRIGVSAFSGCGGLTNVILGHSVTRIGSAAFDGCTDVTSVTFPSSVTSIEDGAFFRCARLTNFTFLGNAPVLIRGFFEGGWFSLVGPGAKAYYYCGTTGWGTNYGGLPTVMLCPPQVNYAVSGSTAYVTRSASASGDIVIASTYNGYPVTSIEHDAFSRCTNLTSVTIPNSVTNIGQWAFENCTSLASVTIPNSVTRIGFSAFIRCSSLTRVTIPASVTSIGSQGFHSCTSLTNFTFLGNPPQLLFDFDGGFNQFANVGAGAKAYYYCGTTGWGTNYGGLPTVMLCPPQIASGSAGVKPGGFGFTLTSLTNQTIVVEASTNLMNWQPIWTNPPPGTSADFVDPEWLNHSNRFYRARSD